MGLPLWICMLNSGVSRTFHEYAYQVFVPHVTCQLESARRADIIFDQYFQGSVKATAMSLRGQGDRRKVKANTCSWQLAGFLAVWCKQSRALQFSSRSMYYCQLSRGQANYCMSTKWELVLCNPERDRQTQGFLSMLFNTVVRGSWSELWTLI